MQTVNLTLIIMGSVVLLIAATSSMIKSRTPFSEPMIALAFGVLVGPAVLNLIDPRDWASNMPLVLEEVVRIVLAIGLMGVAMRLPRNYYRQHWRSMAAILGGVMLVMWAICVLIMYLVLDVSPVMALLLGAIITPTDPIVAGAIVTGRFASEHLPARLRNLISAESGLNDGLGFPLVWLALLLMQRDTGSAITHWLARVLLWEVGMAVIIGGLLGFLAAHLLRHGDPENLDLKSREMLIYTLALSLMVLGATRLLVTDAILAVFVCGLVFRNTLHNHQLLREEEGTQEIIGLTLTFSFFVLLGALLPWQSWFELGWRGVALVALVLLLRRLPAVILLRRRLRPIQHWTDALFVGWFGPIGVAALFYALIAQRTSGSDLVWTVATLVVTASIVVHGGTSTLGIRRYARR